MNTITKIYIILLIIAHSVFGCITMSVLHPPKEQEKTDTEIGQNIPYVQSTEIAPEQYSTIRPDQQPEQDYPNAANWEFYSQKGGTPLRRANADSVGKMFRPDIAAIDTTDLNRFVIHSDSTFYKNFYGDSVLLGFQSSVNIYNSDGNFPPDVTRAARLDTLSNLKIFYPNGNIAMNIYSGDDSTAANGFAYIASGSGENNMRLDENGVSIITGLGQAAFSPQNFSIGAVKNDSTFADIYADTTGNIYIERQYEGSAGEVLGFNAGQTGLTVVFDGSQPLPGQILVAGGDQNFHFADPDTVQAANIYNSDGNFPPDVPRSANLDTASRLTIYYPNGTGGINIYGGTDSTAAGGEVVFRSALNGTELSLDGGGISGKWPNTEVGFFSIQSTSTQIGISQSVSEFQIYSVSPDDAHQFYNVFADTFGRIELIRQNSNNDNYILGFDAQIGEGLQVNIVNPPATGQVLQAASDGLFYFADPDTIQTANIYTANGFFPPDAYRNAALDSASTVNFVYPNSTNAISIYGGTDSTAAGAFVSLKGSSGVTFLQIDDNAIGGEWDFDNGAHFEISDNQGANYIRQDGNTIEITGLQVGGGASQYAISADTANGASMLVEALTNSVNNISSLQLFGDNQGGGVSSQAILRAYDANAPRYTLNSITLDSGGVAILTKGSVGNTGEVMYSDGTKCEWGPNLAETGTLNADLLSYNPGTSTYDAVNANRYTFIQSSGSTPTLTPSVGNTEIIVNDTATTSTVNLNFVPGELDGASYAQPFTTIRWLYNWGSGDCTVQTNKAWLFRTTASPSGASTLTIGTGEIYKLVWIAGSSEANSRFWCFKIQ